MSDYQWVNHFKPFGGIIVAKDLTKLVSTEATFELSLRKLDPSDFKELHRSVREGFCTSETSIAAQILNAINTDELQGLPSCPTIGYLGKKDMNVAIWAEKAKQYHGELIAAAHMVDVDLKNAATYNHMEGWPRMVMLRVVGHRIEVNDREEQSRGGLGYYHARKKGEHLKPRTSKLRGLITQWAAEWSDLRRPLLEYLEKQPNLTVRLSHKAK